MFFAAVHSHMVLYESNCSSVASIKGNGGIMARCPTCGGYLKQEPEFLESPARLSCVSCGWMKYDPNFRKEQPRYFPPDSVDRRIGWQQKNPGYNLYDAKSAAYQLGTSVSHLKDSIRNDSSSPVRGTYHTRWWDHTNSRARNVNPFGNWVCRAPQGHQEGHALEAGN